MTHHLAEMTWTEVRDLDRSRSVAILPVGAVEAHGPHLPIATAPIIAHAMAEDGARRLADAGLVAVILPGIDYTPAGFAAGFPGTVSIRPQTLVSLITDVASSLAGQRFRTLAIANAHFDPSHLRALYEARDRIRDQTDLAVAFPDITRKPWALRLTEEWQSGACHAGCYEGSIVLARRPDLVREEQRRQLPANPVSLPVAIRRGHRTFEQAGGPQAYFGDPAAASAGEGEATIAELGKALEEAVLAVISDR